MSVATRGPGSSAPSARSAARTPSASGPEMRTTAIAPMPGGVDSDTIVSTKPAGAPFQIHVQLLRDKWSSPRGSAGTPPLGLRYRSGMTGDQQDFGATMMAPSPSVETA